ncbi:MAG: hypothetical protein JW965_02370 [Bacteroidales bacterium]|nr:hypothetical protein [Bacteroidales bacterium]
MKGKNVDSSRKGNIAWLIIGIILITLLIKSINLDLFTSGKKLESGKLTLKEKTEDFEYFCELVSNSYPFVEAIEKEKGLDNFYAMEEHYRNRVRETKDNREFVRVVGEMIQRLEQGTAHCDIMAPGGNTDKLDIITKCLCYNVSKKGYYLLDYWWKELDPDRKWAHSDLPVAYRDGYYVLTGNYRNESLEIPGGTAIEKVNGLAVDEYVKSLQHKVWLRFDTHKMKVYSHFSPLIINDDTNEQSWNVTFRLPDSTLLNADIKKINGYSSPAGLVFPEDNAACVELDETTGYIRINSFAFHGARQADYEKIDSFIQGSEGKYEKLIIDLRGNSGGAPKYWEEIFVERLIKEPCDHIQYSIVKKDAFNSLNVYNRLVAYKYRKEIDYGRMEKIDIDEWPYELPLYIEQEEYYFLKNTKEYEPFNRYPFDGKIYLLTDHDTFSAAEDFTKAAKETGFATIVGANTIGGAAVSFAPWVFELPNSHIMISMEIDMAFNEDGSVNEIYGSEPDYILQPSTYPTSMPAAYDAESLMKDPWIEFVMQRNHE